MVSKNPVCFIYYMLISGGFTSTCLQTIVKGGSSRLMLICYMSVICLVQSPPQEAVVVFGYIEGPFLVSRTGCTRECHAPCIEGPFLVSRTGHARERHAP